MVAHAAGKKVDGARVVTLPWDPVDHLKSDEDREAYLQAAIDEGDPELLEAVRHDIARSR